MVRVLVTGATGLLGAYVEEEVIRRGQVALAYGGPKQGARGVELSDRNAVNALFERARPHIVIHSAAIAAIGDCVEDPERARQVNVDGTQNLADLCTKNGVRLVHVSTDLVFDGEEAPYREDATPSPLSVYGTTKRASEAAALSCAGSAVVRVSLLFGTSRSARKGFFDSQVQAFRNGRSMKLFDDEWRTPLSLRAAAEGLVSIAEGAFAGVLHLGGPEKMSRYEMGERLALFLKIRDPQIERSSRLSIPGEPRPRDVSLDSTRFHRLAGAIATASFEDECKRMAFPL